VRQLESSAEREREREREKEGRKKGPETVVKVGIERSEREPEEEFQK
jgi:hypothetical protein